MTTFDYAAARTAMIESQLRPNGVRDIEVLRAFATTLRELFLPEDRRFLAYSEETVEVAARKDGRPARHLMQTMVFAKLVQHAAITPNDRVLDVGCATGYSAAILGKLARRVVALEEDKALAARAKTLMRELRMEAVEVVEGPLTAGAPEQAPFDVILASGRIEVEPESLLSQLKDGGHLFAVFGPERDSDATVFTKVNGTVSRRPLFDAGASLLPGFAAKPVFVF